MERGPPSSSPTCWVGSVLPAPHTPGEIASSYHLPHRVPLRGGTSGALWPPGERALGVPSSVSGGQQFGAGRNLKPTSLTGERRRPAHPGPEAGVPCGTWFRLQAGPPGTWTGPVAGSSPHLHGGSCRRRVPPRRSPASCLWRCSSQWRPSAWPHRLSPSFRGAVRGHGLESEAGPSALC